MAPRQAPLSRPLITLLIITLSAACGPGPQAPPGADERGSWPGAWVGDLCDDQTPCAQGLLCLRGACSWARCDHSARPDLFCAAELGVVPEATSCDAGLCQRLNQGQRQRCTHTDQCAAGLICLDNACARSCTSDQQCDAGSACLRGGCISASRCDLAEDPAAFCNAQLGGAARCGAGRCVALVGSIGAECEDDEECGERLLCEGGRCAPRCVGDADCGNTSLRCVARELNSELRICRLVAADEVTSCAEAADPLAFCARALNLSEQEVLCDETQICVQRAEAPHVLVIEDRTQGAVCNEELLFEAGALRSPGIDLASVRLIRGERLLRARFISVIFGQEPSGNDRRNATFLERDNVLFDEQMCLIETEAQQPSDYVSLGCGGRLVLEFFDGEMQTGPTTGDVIDIIELGLRCTLTPAELERDAYRVYSCPRARASNLASCQALTDEDQAGVIRLTVP